MTEYQKIVDSDALVDWKNKFNEHADSNTLLEHRISAIEANQGTDPNGKIAQMETSTRFGGFGSPHARLESLEGMVQGNKSDLDMLKNKDLAVFNVRDFGAVGDGAVPDESAAIQAALDAARDAGGGEVYVPAGKYNLKVPMQIFSHTRLYCQAGVEFIRNAEIGHLIHSGVRPASGYEGAQNVEVVGGTWDGNSQPGKGFTQTSTTLISFAHCKDLVIRDCVIKDILNHHAIEVNSSLNVKIIDVTCQGLRVTRAGRRTEAVQLDLAKGPGQYPLHGEYDNTPCKNVLIQGLVVEPLPEDPEQKWDRGIGTHSSTPGFWHEDIMIIGCHFRDLTGQAIRTYSWNHVTIQGNTVNGAGMGFEISVGDTGEENDCHGFSIVGNIIKNIHADTTYGYGIWLNQKSGKKIRHSTIEGNVVESTNGYGIYVETCPENIVSNNIVRRAGVNHASQKTGIYLTDSQDCVIQGNRVYECQGHGIYLNNKSDHTVVANNQVTQCKGYGIALAGSKNGNVNGNLNRNNKQDGANAGSILGELVFTSGANDNTITGNVSRNNLGGISGLYITNTCSGNYVINNDVKGSAGLRDNGNSDTSSSNRL